MSVRIHCINKDNGDHDDPHEAITNFGWINEQTGERGRSTRQQMVDFIDSDKGSAYVKDDYNNIVYCYTRQGKRFRFLQTYANSRPTDNLLKLSECSV